MTRGNRGDRKFSEPSLPAMPSDSLVSTTRHVTTSFNRYWFRSTHSVRDAYPTLFCGATPALESSLPNQSRYTEHCREADGTHALFFARSRPFDRISAMSLTLPGTFHGR